MFWKFNEFPDFVSFWSLELSALIASDRWSQTFSIATILLSEEAIFADMLLYFLQIL